MTIDFKALRKESNENRRWTLYLPLLDAAEELSDLLETMKGEKVDLLWRNAVEAVLTALAEAVEREKA